MKNSFNIDFFNILQNEDPNSTILYQLDHFFEAGPLITCQKDSTNALQEVLDYWFTMYNSRKQSKPEVRQTLGNILASLFKLYKDEKVSLIEDDDLRWKHYADWGTLTQSILLDTYMNLPTSECQNGELKSNRDIFRSASFDIDDQVCLALKEEFISRFPDYSLPLSYELHTAADVTTNTPAEMGFRSTPEKANTVDFYNREYFVVEFIPFYNDIQNEGNGITAKLHALEYLERQFSVFTRRMRQSGCYDPKALGLAAMYWSYSTNCLLQRQSIIQTMDILVENNHSRRAKDASSAVNDLKDECIAYVETITNSYLEELEGQMAYPWLDRLTSIGIDYKGLYSDMKGEYFSPSISTSAFKDAFISADFKTIHEEARNKKKSTCILFLIYQLSEHIGQDWGEKAALSIFPDKKTGKEAYRMLQKNSNASASINDEIKEILLKNISTLREKRKK